MPPEVRKKNALNRGAQSHPPPLLCSVIHWSDIALEGRARCATEAGTGGQKARGEEVRPHRKACRTAGTAGSWCGHKYFKQLLHDHFSKGPVASTFIHVLIWTLAAALRSGYVHSLYVGVPAPCTNTSTERLQSMSVSHLCWNGPRACQGGR